MAEILGSVASGIAVAQLAGQVTKSIIKLKEYWDQIKEIPSEVFFLMREIESLNLILMQIQDDQSRNAILGQLVSNICVQQSFELCAEGAKELSALVDDFRAKIEGKSGWKKRIGSAKIILQKEDIKRLKRRMKNAIRLLSLSYQLHTNAMIQLQPEIIVMRLIERSSIMTTNSKEKDSVNPEIKNLAKSSTDLVTRHYQYWSSSASWLEVLFGSFHYKNSLVHKSGRSRRKMSIKYQVPSWVQNKVWEAQCSNELSKLNLAFRTYRVIQDSDRQIRSLIENDDVSGFQNLLQEQKLNVHDRIGILAQESFDSHLMDQVGLRCVTPLYLAAQEGSLEICKLLISQGADTLAGADDGETPLHIVSQCGSLIAKNSKASNAHDITRLLIQHGGIDSLIDDTSILERFYGSAETLHYLQNQCYPSYKQLPLAQKYAIATHFCRAAWHDSPILFKMSFGDGKELLGKDESTFIDGQGRNLLHYLIYGYLPSLVHHSTRRKFIINSPGSFFRPLTREVLNAGALVSVPDDLGRTPLYNLIRGTLSSTSYYHLQIFVEVIKSWLVDLLTCGIDLLDYGLKEAAIQSTLPKDFTLHMHLTPYRLQHVRFLGFAYGPNPDDWHFYFSEPRDKFAGQFWALIENPPCKSKANGQIRIPGAWGHDDEEDWDGSSENYISQDSDFSYESDEDTYDD